MIIEHLKCNNATEELGFKVYLNLINLISRRD